MWNRIKKAIISANDLVKGKRRRIALISGGLTSIGAMTGFVPLAVIGTIGTVLFGGLDAKDNKDDYKKLLGIKNKKK